MLIDEDGVAWEQIENAVFLQTFEGISTWVATFHKVGTEGNLWIEKRMLFNSDGDIWEA